MNIKGLTGSQIPTIRPAEKAERVIHSDQARDRDGNGQQAFGEQQKHREPMTDELLEKALEHLRNLPAVKEHHWTVQLVSNDEKKYVLIKDNLGTLIRRIPEADLWSLMQDEQMPKGQLLKKTA